jgi:hypothetical protein
MLAGVGWHVVEGARSAAPGSAVDQMLIGSGGVYTLSTKSHPGAKIWVGEQAILVDRHKTPYLRNSRSDAERAAVLLSRAVDRPVEVRAALVLGHGSPPSEVRFAGRPADVLVLDAWQLSGALRRTPRRLSEHDVVELVAAARRPETWD